MINKVETSWFVVATKPRYERKVADVLVKKGIECFLPVNTTKAYGFDRKKSSNELLFGPYIFVRPVSSTQITLVKSVSGVVNFMYWQNAPASVSNEEIEVLKDFLNNYSNIYVDKIAVKAGESIKVSRGTFMHKENKILQINNNALKVELPSIGYAVIAHLPAMRSQNISAEEKTILKLLEVPQVTGEKKVVNN